MTVKMAVANSRRNGHLDGRLDDSLDGLCKGHHDGLYDNFGDSHFNDRCDGRCHTWQTAVSLRDGHFNARGDVVSCRSSLCVQQR